MQHVECPRQRAAVTVVVDGGRRPADQAWGSTVRRVSSRRAYDINRQLTRSCRHRMRLEPQRAGGNCRIHSYHLPPPGFVATAMHLPMVSSTQRDGKLIADLAPECAALRKAKMVRIHRPAAANQTRLLGHISDVPPVPQPARFRQCQHALVDHLRQPALRLLGRM